MIDSDRLASFVVFARHRNLTRAARELGLTQPALHAQLAKLGEQVGAPLYRRVGRGLELTEAGTAVLRFGRDLSAQSDALLAEIAGKLETRPVTLAAGEGALLYLLGPGIRQYLKRPPAPLRILTRDRDQTLAAVETGDADLGVAAFERAPDGVNATLLASVPQVLIVPRTHRLARVRKPKLAELGGAALVLPAAGRPQRVEIERALERAGARIEVAVEASGWELMLHFAKLELGLTIVNGFCKPPRGFVARPLLELPVVRYFVLSAGAQARRAVSELGRALLEKAR